MSNETRFSLSNLGEPGGTTVGFTLVNFDASFSDYAARSTVGVAEIGTNSGVFGTSFTVPAEKDLVVLWDTGGADPIYAWNESLSNSTRLYEANNKINIIMNTLRNRSDFEAEMLLRIAGMKERLEVGDSGIAAMETTFKETIPALTDKLTAFEQHMVSRSTEQGTTLWGEVAMKDYLATMGQRFDAVMSELKGLNKRTNPQRMREMEKRMESFSEALATFQGEVMTGVSALSQSLGSAIGHVHRTQQAAIQEIQSSGKRTDGNFEDFRREGSNYLKAVDKFAEVALEVFNKLEVLKAVSGTMYATKEEMKMILGETRKQNIRQLVPYLSIAPVNGRKR